MGIQGLFEQRQLQFFSGEGEFIFSTVLHLSVHLTSVLVMSISYPPNKKSNGKYVGFMFEFAKF